MFGRYESQRRVLQHEADTYLSFVPVPYGLPYRFDGESVWFDEAKATTSGPARSKGCLPVLSCAAVLVLAAAVGLLIAGFQAVAVVATALLVAALAFGVVVFRPYANRVARSLTLNFRHRTAILHRNSLGSIDPLHVWCSLDDVGFGRHEVDLVDEATGRRWQGFALAVTLEGQIFPLAVAPAASDLEAYLSSLPPQLTCLTWHSAPVIRKQAVIPSKD